MSRKKKNLILTAAAALLLLIALAFPRLGVFLVQEHDLRTADAIVILMGSTPERELEAADLYHAGLADKLLMVEFPSHRNLLLDSFNIDMPRGLENTVNVLNQLNVPSEHIHIILVSSPHHLRRANKIFRWEYRKAGHNTEIIARPSNYSDFQAKGWYHHRDSAKAVALEYLKLITVVFQ